MKLHCEPIYGFYHGQDPRTFSPDAEICTPKELAAHRAACEAAHRGEWVRDESGCCEVRPGVKVLRSTFGIGTYHVVMTGDGDFVRSATYEDWCREEPEWEEELEPYCPNCGETGGTMYHVDDRDDSTGYHVTETVCSLCKPH